MTMSMLSKKTFHGYLTFFRPKATCVNTVGSFRCDCLVGFGNFKPYKGCSDIDECAGINNWGNMLII